jgi:hypothetical protein
MSSSDLTLMQTQWALYINHYSEGNPKNSFKGLLVKKEDFSGPISVLSDANTANTTKDYLSASYISLHTVG